jgi:segregation and condensation protein B
MEEYMSEDIKEPQAFEDDKKQDLEVAAETDDSEAMSEDQNTALSEAPGMSVEMPAETGDGAQTDDSETMSDDEGGVSVNIESENADSTSVLAESENVETTVESVIEAVLFASDEPLTEARLESVVELGSAKQVRECIENLNNKYRANNSAFRIEKIAGGYQMLTLSVYNSWLQKMLRARTDSKLSQAALETLAILAYKQPIIRADVEAIRGVASGEIIRSLMFKGLVKIVGRAEVLGRPLLYGTTKKFLEVFGLNTLKDLPKIEELKKPQQ